MILKQYHDKPSFNTLKQKNILHKCFANPSQIFDEMKYLRETESKQMISEAADRAYKAHNVLPDIGAYRKIARHVKEAQFMKD